MTASAKIASDKLHTHSAQILPALVVDVASVAPAGAPTVLDDPVVRCVAHDHDLVEAVVGRAVGHVEHSAGVVVPRVGHTERSK